MPPKRPAPTAQPAFPGAGGTKTWFIPISSSKAATNSRSGKVPSKAHALNGLLATKMLYKVTDDFKNTLAVGCRQVAPHFVTQL